LSVANEQRAVALVAVQLPENLCFPVASKRTRKAELKKTELEKAKIFSELPPKIYPKLKVSF